MRTITGEQAVINSLGQLDRISRIARSNAQLVPNIRRCRLQTIMSLPVVIRVFRRLGNLIPDRDVLIRLARHFWSSGRQAFSSVTSEVSEQGWPQESAMTSKTPMAWPIRP